MPTFTFSPVTPGVFEVAGPSEVGDVPTWDGSGWDFLNSAYDVRSYDAVGNGVADDTTAIQAAIDAAGAAGGGVVFLPTGTYKVTSTLNVTHSSVSIVGAGYGANPGAIQQPAWAPATVIQWAGGASPVLKWEYVQGCRGSDFAIDGGATASHGLYLASFQYGSLARIAVRNCDPNTGIACYMGAQANTANTQWCTFDDLFLDGAQCLYLTGRRPQLDQDVCGCVFRNISCVYYSPGRIPGVVIDFADGNSFFMLYVFCKDLTSGGIGVELKGQARNNFFWHLGSHGNSGGSVVARTPDSAGFINSVMFMAGGGLDGAPDPTIEAGATLNYWSYTNGVSDTFKTNALMVAPKLSLREQALREAQGVKGETWMRSMGTGGNQPAAQKVYMSAVGLMKGDVVTNLLASIVAAGTGTSLSKLALYDSSFNLLRKTADQGTAWNTAGNKTVALTSPYTITTTGLYYIAVLVNAATTLPFLWRVVPNDAVAPGPFTGGGGYQWVFDSGSGRTDFPDPMTGSNTAGPCFWFGWS